MHKGWRGLLVAAAMGLLVACAGGEQAPGVAFTTIKGEKSSFESLRGKVVLVNFWATSCPGCVEEMAKMADTYQRFGPRGYDVVAIAMSYDRPDFVLNFAQTRKLPFKVALDTQGALAQSFGGIMATPTSILIGKDGRVLQKYLGEPDWTALNKLIDEELART